MVDTSHPYPHGLNKDESEARERELARQQKLIQIREDEQRIRKIAADEFRKQTQPLFVMGVLVVLIWWYGWIGVGIWFAGLIALALYEQFKEDRTPGAGYVGLAHLDAEHYVRHCIIADLEQKGELAWEIEDGGAVAADHPEWGTFWQRLERVGAAFDQGSPRYRRKKLDEAKRRSRRARLAMIDYASAHRVEPLYWARVEPREYPLWRRILRGF